MEPQLLWFLLSVWHSNRLEGTKRFLSDVKFDIVIAFYLLLKYVFLKLRSRMWSGMFVVANASLHWSSLVWQHSQFAVDLASKLCTTPWFLFLLFVAQSLYLESSCSFTVVSFSTYILYLIDRDESQQTRNSSLSNGKSLLSSPPHYWFCFGDLGLLTETATFPGLVFFCTSDCAESF